jgi:hypothetical protein
MVPALVRWTYTGEDGGHVTAFVAKCDDPDCNFDGDADFIAHAREDVPRLLATLGQQEAELVQLRRFVRSFVAWADDATLPPTYRDLGRVARALLATP